MWDPRKFVDRCAEQWPAKSIAVSFGLLALMVAVFALLRQHEREIAPILQQFPKPAGELIFWSVALPGFIVFCLALRLLYTAMLRQFYNR